jgi:ketosteroid isomerase-like protein
MTRHHSNSASPPSAVVDLILVKRMESVGTIATLEEFVRRINAHDPKGVVSLCTADHIFIDSWGSQLSGLERLEEAWASYFSLFLDYRIDVEAVASHSAVVLACGFASATHAASKKSWRIPAAWRAIVRDGRIAEWQVYADNKPVYELLSENA